MFRRKMASPIFDMRYINWGLKHFNFIFKNYFNEIYNIEDNIIKYTISNID